MQLNQPMNDVFYVNKRCFFQNQHSLYLLNSDKSFDLIAPNKGVNYVDRIHYPFLLVYGMRINADNKLAGKQV
jgi:hypothetical protein